MYEAEIQQAAALLLQSKYAVALTGAGISTPSGIPDFRSAESGLWEKHDPMVVASLIGFRHRPDLFYEWLVPLARTLIQASPNPAHYALAKLESLGILKSVITQNIDLLHSRAGSKTVYEVHGHIREATCITCFAVYPAESLLKEYIESDGKKLLRCASCGSVLKPNVILFGEQLPLKVFNAAQREVRQCDMMVVAGSSLEVYPVADMPRQARAGGAKLILINYSETDYDRVANVTIRGDVADILPRIVQALEAHLPGS